MTKRVKRKNTLRKNTRRNSRRIKRKNTLRKNSRRVNRKNTRRKNSRRVNRKNTKLFGGKHVRADRPIPRILDEIDRYLRDLIEDAMAYTLIDEPPDNWYTHFLLSKARAVAETNNKTDVVEQIDGTLKRLYLPPASQSDDDISIKEIIDDAWELLDMEPPSNKAAAEKLNEAAGKLNEALYVTLDSHTVSQITDFTARYIDGIISTYKLKPYMPK